MTSGTDARGLRAAVAALSSALLGLCLASPAGAAPRIASSPFTGLLGIPGKIAFVGYYTGPGEQADIYTFTSRGTEGTKLTSDEINWELDPSWSPDGTRIAYVDTAPGPLAGIDVMNADGTGVEPLFSSGNSVQRPQWSPDGSKIAFVQTLPDSNADIYVMNADGSHVVQLTTWQGVDMWPSWSPDGSKITFSSGRTGGNDVFVMNADGSNQVQLTSNKTSLAPTWSPDGTQIAYEYYDNSVPSQQIYLMNPEGRISGRSPRSAIPSIRHGRPTAEPSPSWSSGPPELGSPSQRSMGSISFVFPSTRIRTARPHGNRSPRLHARLSEPLGTTSWSGLRATTSSAAWMGATASQEEMASTWCSVDRGTT
jgi:dipeptidyl aminopeptidase/acylaminoacyl peptidase